MKSEELALSQNSEVTMQNSNNLGHLWIALKRTGLRYATTTNNNYM